MGFILISYSWLNLSANCHVSQQRWSLKKNLYSYSLLRLMLMLMQFKGRAVLLLWLPCKVVIISTVCQSAFHQSWFESRGLCYYQKPKRNVCTFSHLQMQLNLIQWPKATTLYWLVNKDCEAAKAREQSLFTIVMQNWSVVNQLKCNPSLRVPQLWPDRAL